MNESIEIEEGLDERDWTVAHVWALPTCDFCREPAGFDIETRDAGWAFVCGECFADHASPSVMMFGLGLGRGQRLVSVRELEQWERDLLV